MDYDDDDGWDPEAEAWERLATEWLQSRILAALDGDGNEEDERLLREQRNLLAVMGCNDIVAWCYGEAT